MKKLIVLLIVSILLLSCATSIPIKMTKPGEIDLNGARSIAVLPFSFPSQGKFKDLNVYQSAMRRLWYADKREIVLEKNIAKYVEAKLSAGLVNTGYFTVLQSEDLRNTLVQNDTSSKINADILVSGSIITFSSHIDDKSYTDKKTEKFIELFQNTVNLEIKYDIILTSTGELLATRTLDSSDFRMGKYDDVQDTTESIAKGMIPRQVTAITRLLAPYTVIEYRTLEQDQKKDERMKQADKLVTDGFYKKAFDLYTSIYQESNNFAAGYNAAIMKEILGDLSGAIKDMEALADASANSKALKEAERMKRTQEETERAKKQQEAK